MSHEGASIAGQVVSNVGGDVEYWVEYGPTKTYGSESEHRTASTTKNAPAPAPAAVAFQGLARSTVYHYRLCAQDSQQHGGPGCGEGHFKTQSFACGETVRGDVRFTGHVSCLLGVATPGLRIGAAGIDVNLNGFSLTGPVSVGGGGEPAIGNSGVSTT